MSLMHHRQELGEEPRYDPKTLQKVMALAGRLQREHQETLTAGEIEAIGGEVGLDPAFIRQALARVASQTPRTTAEREQKTEFRSLVAALAIPLVWGVLAYICRTIPEARTIFTLITAAPLAGFLGFLTGKKNVGRLAAIELVAALAPTYGYPEGGMAAHYAALGLPFAAWLGNMGASIRERYFPFSASSRNVSRPALLNLLFMIQTQLEGQKQHRAFLSVDVAGSSEMKLDAPALAVEHSFGQYRQWVEAVVHECGGEMQSAAGDGVMCIFPSDAAAIRAACLLQTEMAQFNATQNRLPRPFRIRCGVSAGEIALEEGTPLGHLQSPVIDRAAALQKRAEPGDILVSGEATAAALTELGRVVPLPDPVAGMAAFSWKGGQKALEAGE